MIDVPNEPIPWNGEVLIGITGQPLAGKDECIWKLESRHNLLTVSSSAVLGKIITDEKLGDTTPQNMNVVSTQLRGRFGGDFLVRMILGKHKDAEDLVIGGIRLISEAETIHRHGGIIVAVVASQPIRCDRRRKRGRPGDDIPLDDFIAFEKLEAESVDPLRHNVNAVIAMANYCIPNVGTPEELDAEVDKFMAWVRRSKQVASGPQPELLRPIT